MKKHLPVIALLLTLITIIVFSCVKDSATKEEKKQKFYRVVQVDKNGTKYYTPILRLNK